ncbi:MAG TPA: winged helix-turn-helix domain-containing protein [Acetobacteraceae bacterium]|jgi:TolB-like protein|nr:winged helix-turn-helix domain-containing protein [Acetobacteraceae bacterium]
MREPIPVGPISIGPFQLDPASHSVTRADGTLLPLGTRAMDLLLVLARANGEVVSKAVIMDAVWPGLVVEENNIQVQVSALRRALGEQWIVTIPARGYRLVRTPVTPAEPSRPVLAVLPFTDIGRNPDHEHIADGITEEITTAVGRARWFLVIGRNSAFAYKGRTVDLKQVGRELGVRYVLQGSVRRAGEQLRITAQLAETETGTQVWAERFDGTWKDVFALQDSIATSVAVAIEPELRDMEIARAQRRLPGNLNAYEFFLCGMSRFYRATQDGMAARLRDVEEAIALDPDYAAAHALAAQCLMYYVNQGYSDDRTRDCAEGARHARTAVALDSNDPTVLSMAGHALGFHAREWETSVHLLERSIVLNPSSAFAYTYAGWANCYAGAAQRVLGDFDTALQLSPIDRHCVPEQFREGDGADDAGTVRGGSVLGTALAAGGAELDERLSTAGGQPGAAWAAGGSGGGGATVAGTRPGLPDFRWCRAFPAL